MYKQTFLFFVLTILFGCTNEDFETQTKDFKETSTNSDFYNKLQNNVITTFYKASKSNDIYYSYLSPNNKKCVVLEKKLKINGKSPQSSKSPSQVFFKNKLYIVYKAGRSNNVYYAYFDGVQWKGDYKIRVNGNSIQSSMAPSCVVFDNKLYIVYKGGHSNNVYYSYFDGLQWKGDSRIRVSGNSIQTNKTPSATIFNNNLYIVYKGGGSNNIYYSYFDGLQWKGDSRIRVNGNSIQTSMSPSPTVYNNNLYIVYKAGNSNNVYYAYFDGILWKGDYRIKVNGNYIQTGNSPSSTIINNNLYIVYKAGKSNNIYYSFFDGLQWNGDNKIFGIQTSSSPNALKNALILKPFVSNLLSISPTSKKVYFSSTKSYPNLGDRDEHIQGIQAIDYSNFLLSSSNFNSNIKKGLIIPVKNGQVETNNVKEIGGYGHAGGIQFKDNTLVVALAKENSPSTTSKKVIRFYKDNLSEMTEFDFTSSDAQASGFINVNETQRLVLVVTSQNFKMEYQIFNKVNNTWVHSKDSWNEFYNNDMQESTQNINVFKEDNLFYLVGLRGANKSFADRDALDIYRFTLDNSSIRNFNYLGSLYLDGNNMREAGGINIINGSDIIVSSFGKEIKNGINSINTYTNE